MNPKQIIQRLINTLPSSTIAHEYTSNMSSFPVILSTSSIGELRKGDHSFQNIVSDQNAFEIQEAISAINYYAATSDTSSSEDPSLSLPDSFDYYKITPNLSLNNSIKNRLKGVNGGKGNRKYRRSKDNSKKERICDRCVNLEQNIADMTKENQIKIIDLKKRCDLLAGDLEAKESELLRIQKVKSVTEENNQLEIVSLRERCDKLNVMLEAETIIRQQMQDKAMKCDRIEEELKRFKIQVSDMESIIDQQRHALTLLSESEGLAKANTHDNMKLKELLEMDKNFLQSELKLKDMRYEEKSRALEQLESKNISLELKVSQLTDQLLTLQLNARSGFDERMERELMRIKEDSQRELDGLKATAKEISDRENRVLRETKESLEHENENLKRRNESLTVESIQLQREISQLSNDKNNEISELRADLKMKAFELNALGITFEERMSQLRQCELEIDALRKEVAMQRSALLKMESDHSHIVMLKQAEFDKLALKVQSYETLEVEIDSAVMRSAAQTNDHNIDIHTQRLLSSVKGIPIDLERRVKQAVTLAQKLLECERIINQNNEKISNYENKIKIFEENELLYKKNISLLSQPTAYLINKLHDEELQKIKLYNNNEQLLFELNDMKNNNNNFIKENNDLKERLIIVLQQRDELESYLQRIEI
eukprot:gene12270-16453_t